MANGIGVPNADKFTLQESTPAANPTRLNQPAQVGTANSGPRKLRVLLVMTRVTIGGDTNVVLDIAEYLKAHPGYEVHLAAGPVPENEVDLTYLVHERAIPFTAIPSLVNRINPTTNLKAVLELRKVIVEGQYDIVHTHCSVAGVVGRMAAALARVPVVVHHIHGWGVQEDMSNTVKGIYLTLEKCCALVTDRLVAVSKPTIDKGLAYGICPEKKFALIYNGIPLEKFRKQVDEAAMRQTLGLAADSKLVGMIARLDKQKNPLDFIRAAALVVKEYKNVQFLIAGHGVLRSDCEALIQELHLQEHFFLLGFRSDIDKIMPILDITVMSSLWEGLPVAFQEAMSAGKPIVANDVDGVSDVVIDGETGFLVQPHHPEQMAARLLQLLNDSNLCTKMGAIAMQRSEQFSDKQMLQNMDELYQSLCKKARILS